MAKQLVGKEFIDLDESWRSEPGATPTWGRIIRNELYFDDKTRKYSYYDAATKEEVVLSKEKLDILTASPNFTLEPTYKIGDTGIEPVPVGYDASETFVQGLFDDPDRGTLYDDPEGQLDPRYERGVTERQDDTDRLLAGGADPFKQKAARDAARKKEQQQAQLGSFAPAIGAAAALAGFDYLQTEKAYKDIKERIEQVKAEELGKPIVPAEEMAAIQEGAKMTGAATRAAAGEEEMRESERQAAQGGITTASAGVIRRRERGRRIDEGLARAGQQYGAQLYDAIHRGKKRKFDILNAVAAAQSKLAVGKAARASARRGDFMTAVSPVLAQMPARDPGMTDPIYDIADAQEVPLKPEDAAKISWRLRRLGPGVKPEQIEKILRDYELEATDEAISSLTRSVYV